LYLLLFSKKELAARSWNSHMMFLIPLPVFDSLGLPKGPRKSKIGSVSVGSSYTINGLLLKATDVLVPIDALVSAPII